MLETSSFDGQICSVIDVDLVEEQGQGDPVLNDNTYFFDPDRGHYIPAKYHWMRMLLGRDLQQFHREIYGTPPSPRLDSLFKVSRENFAKYFPSEIVDTVLNGRLKFSLLLDSNGGDIAMAFALEALIRDVEKRGGQVDVYVGKKALSAAGRLFLLGHRRFVESSSRVMVHNAYDSITGTPSFDPYGSLQREYDCLSSRVPSAQHSFLDKKFRGAFPSQTLTDRGASRRARDVHFRVPELQRLDLVDAVYNRTHDLIARLLRETGREDSLLDLDHPNNADELDPVAAYYYKRVLGF